MDGGTGRCLCGNVRYRFEGTPNWQVHCHCESCRRATSSPFTSFFAVDRARFGWVASTPAEYRSSPGATRAFCPRCGSQMAYQSHERSHEIDLYACTLDAPETFAATAHVHAQERLPWLRLADGLPRRYTPRRLEPGDDMGPVLDLMRTEFAYMDGVIDPPSSMHRLSLDDIARQAGAGEVWVIEERDSLIACVFLTPKADALYVGKLAVAGARRGEGLARQLIDHAAVRARARGLGALELQTRVELSANQRAFAAMGFVPAGETAHEGFDRATSRTYRRALD